VSWATALEQKVKAEQGLFFKIKKEQAKVEKACLTLEFSPLESVHKAEEEVSNS
jgi:hypothetical protein